MDLKEIEEYWSNPYPKSQASLAHRGELDFKQLIAMVEELESEVKRHEDLELELAKAKHENWLGWKSSEARVKELEEQLKICHDAELYAHVKG